MKFYSKKGKLPGDDKYEKAPNMYIVGVRMSWMEMINGLKKIATIFKKTK